MAVNSADECESACGIVMLSDGGSNIPECESQKSVEVPGLNEVPKYFVGASKCENFTNTKMAVVHNCTPPNSDIDVEKGKLETPQPSDEIFQNLKVECSLTSFWRVLQREISLHVGDKFMQYFMTNNLELPKFVARDRCMTERVSDMPTSRSRKFKRSVSFNSRRVVLLFSILSMMGSVILICLTLRVRQIGEASTNL